MNNFWSTERPRKPLRPDAPPRERHPRSAQETTPRCGPTLSPACAGPHPPFPPSRENLGGESSRINEQIHGLSEALRPCSSENLHGNRKVKPRPPQKASDAISRRYTPSDEPHGREVGPGYSENLPGGAAGAYRGPMRRKHRTSRITSAPSVVGVGVGLLGALLVTGLSSAAAADPSKLPTPYGFNYGDTETTRIAALGGALRAVGTGTAGMFLNPASLAVTRMYHIEALGDASPELSRIMGGAAVADSMMNRYRLAGGVAVLAGLLDPDGADWSTLEVRAALAYPFSERFFLGIGGRYARLSQGSELAPPAGGGADDKSTLSLEAFTFDAGLIVKPADSLHIALLGQNLATTNKGSLPRMIGGGIGFGTKDFSIEVDGLADLTSYESAKARLMGGGEVLVADHVPIRLGYRFDQGPKIHSISAGLGYIGTEFSAELSVRRSLSDPGATSFFVGLAYFLESSSLLKAAAPDMMLE